MRRKGTWALDSIASVANCLRGLCGSKEYFEEQIHTKEELKGGSLCSHIRESFPMVESFQEQGGHGTKKEKHLKGRINRRTHRKRRAGRPSRFSGSPGTNTRAS